ncbi:unnamed protein product [Dovyalis caffra]|uniref:Uncharacterized protein n=1 Tax=Dovyalis caffra TaxID=77055 RepID=A0AAV1RVI1_9ROSI|nr:unnamed protein product [Dovyalis caffra]
MVFQNSEGDYYWSHGLISDATYELLTSVQFPNAFDDYNAIGDIYISSGQSSSYPFRRRFEVASSTQSVQEHLNENKDAENVDVCVQEKASKYLNRKDVEEALHAQLVGVAKWAGCSGVMNYDKRNFAIPTINIVGSLVVGWTEVYGDILTFATIRGAGHLAPLTSLTRSLALFAAFLSGKPFPEA